MKQSINIKGCTNQRRCKCCSKDILNPRYNQIFCSVECQKINYDLDYENKKKLNRCVICGFWRFIESHHIIKQIDFGSNNKSNLVYLCPNHHKMADSRRYGEDFLKLLKKKIGKVGGKLSLEEITRVKNYITTKYKIKENSYAFTQELRSLISSGIFYSIASDKSKRGKSIVI